MLKVSKLVNGANVNFAGAVLHGSPVPNFSVPPIQIYGLPILKKKAEPAGEVTNNENSVSNSSQKMFLLSGVTSSEPSVLLMSDFVPIYENGFLNKAGESIYLREVSKILNTKVSLMILSGCSGSYEYARSHVDAVKNFIDREEGSAFSSTLLDLIDRTCNSLDVKSMSDILFDCGYPRNQINKYCSTKIFLQTLVDVKRSVSTYSNYLVTSDAFSRNLLNEDSDPFLLSDIKNVPHNIRRFWINPKASVPGIDDIISKEKISQNSSFLDIFSSVQFIEFIDNGEKRETSYKILDSFKSTGKDVAVLGNILIKEILFSKSLISQENINLLSSKYGYTVSTGVGEDNFSFWDFIFGKFQNSSFDNITNNNINSIALLSQELTRVDNDTYQIETFENSPIEGSNITPGVEYYIDSFNVSADRKKFETAKLEKLNDKSSSQLVTFEIIKKMLGRSEDSSTLPSFLLSSILAKLSGISLMYGWNTSLTENSIGSLDVNKIKYLSTSDNYGLRGAGLVCKLCVDPSEGYKSVSGKLKNLIFMWLMNILVLRERTSEVQVKCWDTIPELRSKISELICGVFTNISEDEYVSAHESGRVFSTTSANFSLDLSSPSVKSTESFKIFSEMFSENVISIYESGVWKSIVDVMYELGNRFSIFKNVNQIYPITGYSNITRETYLYNCFELILRIISAQVPENIVGVFSTKEKCGLLIDKPSPEQMKEYFDPALVRVNMFGGLYPGEQVSNKLNSALSVLWVSTEKEWGYVQTIQSSINEIVSSSRRLLDFLRSDVSQVWLNTVTPVYDNDSSLLSNTKLNLINLSVTRENLVSSLWRESEMTERVWSDKFLSVIKSHPALSDLPDWTSAFLPVSPMSLVSFPFFSSYFKDVKFQKTKGNNLKIISVGVPHRLNRSLRSNVSVKNPLSNIVKIRVFKLDRLHPDIVYKPQEFLFEMNRFSTRSSEKWKSENLLKDTSDLFSIPTKLINYNGNVIDCGSYFEGFLNDIYGNSLSANERQEIYKNHSMSFLLEEYLRWFSGVELNEEMYGKIFSSPTATFPTLDENFMNIVTNEGGRFKKENEKIIDSKSTLIDPGSSLRMYLRNETFLLNPNTLIKKHVYPRKFDRVFTMLIDPDSFTVDTAHSTVSTLEALVGMGVLIKNSEGVYLHRDTSEKDIMLNEFFTTIEPLEYTRTEV